MQFRVLGPVEVAAARPVRLGSGRQRVVLAVLLAARGGAVSADRLIDALWGATPPVSARKSLHSHVSRLRRTLAAPAGNGAEVITTTSDGYRLDAARHDVDADRFETLLERARRDLTSEPQRAVRGFDTALTLWRGDAFGEMAVHELVRPEAVRLNELRSAAAADRVDALLAAGQHQRVIGDLEAAVTADPLAERPHGQLMLALYRSGRQVDALAVYGRVRQRLGEELGIDPSSELRSLHERILRQDADLAAPRERGSDRRHGTVSGADRPATPGAAAARLIGRDDDLPTLASWVSSARLVTLTGPGGVGKSRLALAVAAEVRDRFEDGVVVCELAGVQDPERVTDALVDAVGAATEGDRPPAETLLTAVGTRRLLVVLDNCEHLLAAAAAVVDRVLRRCPRVAILATSREHLHLPGERVWDVTPLAVPRRGATAAEVARSPAGALFRERAGAVAPSFALSKSNAPMVAELCRRLDGIPLAIELAAARVRAVAVADLVERIDDRFEVLTGGPPTDDGRHRTLQAVVAWSYDLLTDADATLFDRLSVFAGVFPLAAAEQVCAGEPLAHREIAGLLAGLVDKSLVVVDREHGRVRYRLLDTLRAYGARRLDERGEADAVRRAHAEYHVRLAEVLGARVRGPDERGAIAGLDAAVDDLRVAQGWLLLAGQTGGALRLPAALHDDLVFRPRTEVFAWAERAVQLPRAQAHPAQPAALVTVARAALERGELDRGRRLAEAALGHVDGACITALWGLYLLTTVSLYEGRLDDALALAEQRIRLAGTLEDDYHLALAGVSRALAYRYRGDRQAAARAAAEARKAAERSGNHTARAWARYAGGEALLDTDPSRASALLVQAIEAARRVRRGFIEGVALVSLASLRGRLGETTRALELFRQAIVLWRRLGNHTNQLTTLRNLVELLARLGADETAALLHGAVATGATPTFGGEAQRLATAGAQVAQRLGGDAAASAAEQGRRLSFAELVDTALAELDGLRARSVPASRPEAL